MHPYPNTAGRGVGRWAAPRLAPSLLAVGMALLPVACSDDGGAPPAASPGVTMSGPSPSGSVVAEVSAIWPEVTQATLASAAPGAPAWRHTAESTVLRFAADVLRWPTARVAGGTQEENGTYFTVERSPGGSTVRVGAARLGGTTVWSVIYVHGYPGGADPSASVSVQKAAAQVFVGFWSPAVSRAVVEVGYDRLPARQAVTRPPLEARLTVARSASSTGYVLVRFFGPDGAAVAAWGTPLPAGDFAAG